MPYGGEMAIRPGSTGLWAARNQVRRVARDLRFSGDDSADILLAVGEALSNAYLHGCPDHDDCLIYLGWWFAGEELTITVRDRGSGFGSREASLATAAAMAHRGHGLRLMRKGVDEVRFEFDGGTKVVLKKRVLSPR